jgi:hypothetical protein
MSNEFLEVMGGTSMESEENEFFYNLLRRTSDTFEKAPIKKRQLEKRETWNYAVCETQIQKGKPVYCGINWGGSNKQAQTKPPEAMKEPRKWPFVTINKPCLREVLGIHSIDEINYTNVCFFRSPREQFLEDEDWVLSFPLFKSYVEFINPPYIILVGLSARKKLIKHGVYKDTFDVIKHDRIKGYKGEMFGKYKCYVVPHTNYRIKKSRRIDLWRKLFDRRIYKPFFDDVIENSSIHVDNAQLKLGEFAVVTGRPLIGAWSTQNQITSSLGFISHQITTDIEISELEAALLKGQGTISAIMDIELVINSEGMLDTIQRLNTLVKENNLFVSVYIELDNLPEKRTGDKKPDVKKDLIQFNKYKEYIDHLFVLYRYDHYGIHEDEHGNDVTGVIETKYIRL